MLRNTLRGVNSIQRRGKVLHTLTKSSQAKRIRITENSTCPRRYKASNAKVDNHEAPLPVRMALVGSSTALCTPVFPAIGVVNVFLRLAIQDAQVRAKFNSTIGAVCNVAFYYVLPWGLEFSPLLLPCAIGNGVIAMGTYGVMDAAAVSLGRRAIMTNPLIAGGGIGAVTGGIAPYYLYGPICEHLYGLDGFREWFQGMEFVTPFFTQISIMTGFAAGTMMYPFLHYPIHGIKGLPWQALSGTLLLASGMTMYYIYRPDGMGTEYLPEGSFVDKEEIPLLHSIIRYDNSRNEFGAYSLYTNDWIGSPELKEKGQNLADGVRKYQTKYVYSGFFGREVDTENKNYTFDNKVLTFYNFYLDPKLGTKHPDRIVEVRDEKEIQMQEESMYRTDWVVRNIMEGFKTHKCTKVKASEENELKETDRTINDMKMYGSAISDKECQRRAESIKKTSVAVELFMILLKQSSTSETQGKNKEDEVEETNDSSFAEFKRHLLDITGYETEVNKKAIDHSNIDMAELESTIRKRAKGILLLKKDEEGGLNGQSVESQLENLYWQPSEVRIAIEKWQDLQGKERRQEIRNGVRDGILVAGLWLAAYMLQAE